MLTMLPFFRRVSARLARSKSAGARQLPPAPPTVFELLGRAQVQLDTPEIQRFIGGKRILVTGAGGSIGSEICRQLMKFCPERVVLLDQAENALFEIDRELRERWAGATLLPYVADITDAVRIDAVFDDERPHVVFHAAAHKHVPMMELNPGEALKNNVMGTQTVADAAKSHGAAAFVLVSTDKAVNPTSVMGAAKRCAELYVQALNEVPELHAVAADASRFSTRFLAVRFGNVLGSSGSVVPIFQRQIDAGGPVTLTHAEMRRFFMTIPEAAQLVMQAGAIGQGGEIFVLDMGEPVKIIDLAHEMIRRNGLVAGRDIELKITGMRPGEKLYEELAGAHDETRPTGHDKIRVWQLPRVSAPAARAMIRRLSEVVDLPRQHVVSALADCVPEYRPDDSFHAVETRVERGPFTPKPTLISGEAA